jgi:hypothetical protein
MGHKVRMAAPAAHLYVRPMATARPEDRKALADRREGWLNMAIVTTRNGPFGILLAFGCGFPFYWRSDAVSPSGGSKLGNDAVSSRRSLLGSSSPAASSTG